RARSSSSSSRASSQPPELGLVEKGDAVALLPEPLDLDELPARVAPGGLERIRAAADDDGRLRRRSAVDGGACALGGPGGLAAFARQDAGEGEVHASERPQPSDLEGRGRMRQSLDQLLRAL